MDGAGADFVLLCERPSEREHGVQRGATRDAATIDRAAALAAAGAEPLKYNGYKLTLVENLVRRAIRGA